MPRPACLLFITGSDTGAGKTVLATLLTRHLRERGVRVAGLKPVCSGNRADARALHQAAGKVLPLDKVNPWHFRAALAPVLAARKENQRLVLRDVVTHIRRVARNFEVVVIEGAGGLLSPLGEDFDSRDLLLALRAWPVIVCPDRLGAVNQALLTLGALSRKLAARTPVVLSAVRPTAASAWNAPLLRERIGAHQVHELPHVAGVTSIAPQAQAMLTALVATLVCVSSEA